ncbi:hypothetical protein LBMAG42_29330 [Deltaproteobacteria bacterium]|nr:hypothetical protein LBMAG42_29330 [Deltaproteobacteria bacterium]
MLIFLSAAAALPIVPDARFALALYCNPTCSESVLDELDAALSPIRSADTFSDHVAVPERIMGIGGTDFGIPDEEFVTAYGVDVDRPEALAASQEVVLAWFAGPREQSIETFAVAHTAFAAAARSTGGWIEDLDTQMLFGAEAWAARDPRGNLQNWFVVDEDESADATGTTRLVTRGLRRYGDFELVVEDVAAGREAEVGWALDAIAITLHPLSEVAEEVAVNTDTAKGTARFEVSAPKEDDPAEPLLRVRFEGEIAAGGAPLIAAEPEPGGDPVVAPGSAPETTPAGPAPVAPTTLDEARAAVRTALVTLESAWAAGFPPGDVLAVCVPFTTNSGGKEYLWVEVTRWQEGGLSGRLATEPDAVSGMHKGDTLNLRQADIFDYVYRRADGSKSGNLTRPFR